ncbi:MAG: hypothetical protein H0W25_14850 [Acidimicrobiia bacterium]|nr:hypothetical protein [Acidimicrobiia bacterium]
MAQERLSIATGGTGGVYYPYGGGLANLISNEIEGIDVTAEVTPASVDNLLLIETGDVDLAFVLADTLADAAAGTGYVADHHRLDLVGTCPGCAGGPG